MIMDFKYVVWVNDFLFLVEVLKVVKIICNGRLIVSGDMLWFVVGWVVMVN